MEKGVLYNTTDYKQFNYLDVNRDINHNHVLDLVIKIRKKNLLHLCPMIINDNNDIFDGQHRLGAAEIVQTPIYFLFDPDITHEDIITINSTSNSWKAIDYLKFYATKGVPSYLKLQTFFKNNPKLAIDTCLWLMAPVDRRGNLMNNFRAGLVSTQNYSHAAEVASVLLTLSQIPDISKKMLYKVELIYAISSTKMDGTFNMDKLTRRIQQDINLFMVCETQNDFLQLLKLTFQI